MTGLPTISVVVPSFNQGDFLERTLESVFDQDLTPLEIIVRDGGSTDGSRAVLEKHADRLSWVSGPDGGQAAAVNAGIEASQGEIIGWLNSDDIWFPGTLRRVAETFAASPDVDVVYGDADHIDRDGHFLQSYLATPFDPLALRRHCLLCQPATFFRRNVVERFGGLDEGLHYCLDYEFWLRLADHGVRFLYLRHRLAGSRFYASTKTVAGQVAAHYEANCMLGRRYGRVPTKWLANWAHARLRARQPDLESEEPTTFARRAAWWTRLASLYWNRRVPRQLLRETRQWMERGRPAAPVNAIACRTPRDSTQGPRTVGYDASLWRAEQDGCSHYSRSLWRALSEAAPERSWRVDLHLNFGGLQQPSTPELDDHEAAHLGQQQPAGGGFDLWQEGGPLLERALGHPKLLHSTNFSCPAGLENTRLVYTLYDLSFLHHPEWSTEANRLWCLDGLLTATANADVMVAISHSSRSHLLETFPHYPPERVVVAPPACRFEKQAEIASPALSPEALSRGYFLALATLEPRKNHARLLRAYRRYLDELTSGAPRSLVLAGSAGWMAEDLEEQAARLGLRPHINWLGHVSDTELQRLIQHAIALVYPTLFEGFGMPVLEAMSLGTPVLTSRHRSVVEITRTQCAVHVDALSVESMASGLRRLDESIELRTHLADAGLRRAAHYSWNQSAKAVLDAYELALALPPYRGAGRRERELSFRPPALRQDGA